MTVPSKHYSGGLRSRLGAEGVRRSLAGWAACASGDAAYRIRATGNHTHDRAAVTCKKCLALLAKELPDV